MWTLNGAVPPETVKAVVEAYNTKEPIREIAERFGIDKATVYRLARKAGISRRLVLSPEKVRAIVGAYSAKEPIKNIAERFGTNRHTVYWLAKKEGLVPSRQVSTVSPETAHAIIEAYTKESVKSIAKRFNVHVTTVRRIARKANLTSRLGTPEAEKVAIVEAYLAKEPLTSIARRFNVHKRTVRNLARKAGISARRWVSPEKKRAIVEIHRAAKLTNKEIAKLFSISEDTVAVLAKEAGIDYSSTLKADRALRDQAIAQAYSSGEHPTSLARRFQMSQIQIYDRLRRLKVPKHIRRLSPEIEHEILRLACNTTKTVTEISQQFNVPAQSVNRILALGICPKPKRKRALTRCTAPFLFPMTGYRQNVLKYRLAVAQQIGRCLTPEEKVHHINHDPTDNHPKNLMLFRTGAEHIQYERHGTPAPIWSGCPACAIPGNDPYVGPRNRIWARIARLERPEREARRERLERLREEREEEIRLEQELRRKWEAGELGRC